MTGKDRDQILDLIEEMEAEWGCGCCGDYRAASRAREKLEKKLEEMVR